MNGLRPMAGAHGLETAAAEPLAAKPSPNWKRAPRPRRSRALPFAVALASAALSGCGGPIAAPDREIIHATENEISIGTWEWVRPDSIAVEHCRRFGKEAVFLSSVRAQDYGDARIVYYSCVWPNYGG